MSMYLLLWVKLILPKQASTHVAVNFSIPLLAHSDYIRLSA